MRKLILVAAIFIFSATQFFSDEWKQHKQQQQVLAATVMITITTPNWQETPEPVTMALPIPNDEYRTIARAEGNVEADGLGTLVATGQETLLVTHDHWSRFDEALGTVTFRAADGTWLAEMALRDFQQHLRYRNGGTMVLTAPDVLATAVPGKAHPLQTTALTTGDSVFLAQQSGDQVIVTEARVIAQSEKQGLPVVRLQSEEGQVVGGDSGGGVWLNGRLAGTMWATVMIENSITGERRITDLSVAAVLSL